MTDFPPPTAQMYFYHKSEYERFDNQMRVVDPRIDTVWHSDITYAIMIPFNPSMVDARNLLNAIERQSVYNRYNTLLFYTKGNEKNINEFAPDFKKVFMEMGMTNPQNRDITYYTIEKKKDERFDYLMKKIE